MDDLDQGTNSQDLLSIIYRSPKLPAFSGEEIPGYFDGIVSFTDTLGFKEIINKSTASDVSNILNVFYATSIDYCNTEKEMRIINFSDSTVRVCPIIVRSDDAFELQAPSPLLSEIKALASIQFELACWYGVFLRGGLSFGSVFAKSGIVFGPAFIEAYQLEAQHAIYPRILVDPKLINGLEQYPLLIEKWIQKTSWANGFSQTPEKIDNGLRLTQMQLEQCLLIDEKFNIFLDYLGMLIKGADIGFVLNHKKAIIGKYQEAKEQRIREKYTWLKEYHNFSVSTGDNFCEIGINDSNVKDYLISDSIIPKSNTMSNISRFRF